MGKASSPKEKPIKRAQAPGRGRRLFKLLDKVHVPLFVFSTDDQKITLIFTNSAGEREFGHGAEAIGKKQFHDLFHESEAKRCDAIATVLRDSRGERLLEEPEMRALTKGGRKLPVKMTASALKVGSDQCLLLCLSDLSEQKRNQDERERALKEFSRISKLADLGQLVAGVAHELNNPLTVVQGFAENIELILESETIDRDDMKLQLESILKASDRMARIISRMMRMVRQDDFRTLTVDLRDVVGDALQFMGHRFDDFQIEVVNKLDAPLLAHCDPHQIEQILLNLFSNAVHALRKREGTRTLTVQAESSEAGVSLKVKNNGAPIPEEIKDRIMTPFFTTKPVGEGTGLGLAVSYGIMKNHGGDLSFVSNEQIGVEFNLQFPPVLDELQGLATATPGRKVLVADDNEEIRKRLAVKLERYGYLVYQAKDGDEVMQIVRGNSDLECVFADLVMPRWTALKTLPEVRERLPNALIYALTDSGHEPAIEVFLKSSGVTGVLSKPIDQDAFADVIRQLESTSKKTAA